MIHLGCPARGPAGVTVQYMLSPKNRVSRTAALVAAPAMVVGASAAQAAPTTLSPEKGPTIVAAYAGTVMWSQKDDVTGNYKLVKSVDGGAPVVVDVPEREGPFDVDLGTNRNGSVFAVYTREGFIYRMRVSTGVEERLDVISLGGQNSYPTIMRGRIAFLHSGRGHSELRLAGSTNGVNKPKVLVKGVINHAELGLTQIAYTTYKESTGTTSVHIRNTGTGRDRVVYTARSGGANQANVTKPSFSDDFKSFVWARTNNGSGTGNRIIKYTMRTGKLSYAQGNSRYASTGYAGTELGAAFSTALDPATNSGCDDAGVHYCSVGLTGPLSFSSKP